MLTPIFDRTAPDDFGAFEQGLRLPAAMRFHDTDDDIIPVFPAGLCLMQHLIGFADAWSGADKDFQLAVAAFLAPRRAGLPVMDGGRTRAADPPFSIWSPLRRGAPAANRWRRGQEPY